MAFANDDTAAGVGALRDAFADGYALALLNEAQGMTSVILEMLCHAHSDRIGARLIAAGSDSPRNA